jgi:hypothetical protein
MVQGSAKLFHTWKRPTILLKVDIARAFDCHGHFFYRSWTSWVSQEPGETGR